MKKYIISMMAVATVTIAGWNYQQNKEIELSDLAMENVEALANGESESNLDCEGLLGICSFECDKCGADWTAIGSTMKGSHTCQQ